MSGFFFSSRRRHTRLQGDWSSDVCSSDLVSELHARVAAVALAAAAGHGFALGGGNALLAHGVISRPTQDVDLFTDREHGVEALRDAGFEVEREEEAAGLADISPVMGEGLAEWLVTAPDGQELTVQ